MTRSNIGPESGELLLHTDVTGSAARMGHRLTIALTRWTATVDWEANTPSAVEVTVELDSLQPLRGEGGLTPLSGAEKALIRTNALKTLRAKRFPRAVFRSERIVGNGDAMDLFGRLELNGRGGEQTVRVDVDRTGDTWRICGAARVRHSDFGLTRYSMLMGAMKVADEVGVTLVAACELPGTAPARV